MIRRVGVSGLTLLIASSALAVGVLAIGGPFASDVDWLADASFTPVVLERPQMRLPAVTAREDLTLAGIGLAMPAAIRINPPAVAAAQLEDPGLHMVVLEAPEIELPNLHTSDAGALAAVSGVRVQAPELSADVEVAGIRLASLGSHEAALPDVPVTDAGALAAVSGIMIQPPDTRPLRFALEEGFVAIELQPVEAGLDPVEAPAREGLLCLGGCSEGAAFATCDKNGGAT